MRIIKAELIKKVVKELCIKANLQLRGDVLSLLKRARAKEKSLKARRVLDIIIDNALIAKRKKLPICQDTNIMIVYLKVGQSVMIKGDIKKAVEEGVAVAIRRATSENLS